MHRLYASANIDGVWLQWQAAVAIAIVGLMVGGVWRRSSRGWQRAVAAFGLEAALVLVLYAIWILAGRVARVHVDEGFVNGRWIYDIQRDWHLPNELDVQDWILQYPWAVRFTNAYYAVAHVPAMVIALLWLFLAHRDRYARWRTALALTTFACLLIQFIPAAPPRLYPELGFVDTAWLYDQSVYGRFGTGVSDQLSAMPSVHVAWAVWVAAVVIDAGVSRWRWLVLAHLSATLFAVTATANHWWLDGVVAAALLAVAVGLERRAARLRKHVVHPVMPTPAFAASSSALAANEALEVVRPINTSSGSRRSST